MATQTSGAFTDLGKTEDLYYTDPDNCKVEAIPLEYNTRFSQNLSNLSAGTSVFVIPPGNGLKHVILVLGWNASSITAQSGENALNQGWGYQAVNQISFRVGGSSQYFMTGAQLLAKNLRQVRTQTQAQALLQLGGNECKIATDFNVAQYAYIPIPIWCTPSADGLGVPLPADTLAQQIQVTVQLNPTSTYVINNGVSNTNPFPTVFDTGYFQVEQLCMVDRGMAISNHVDLNSHELLMPVTFDQQELQIPVPNVALGTTSALTLTGFRSGQVKALQMWLTKNGDVNSNIWYLPQAVTVLYAGTIYSQYQNGSSQLFNLLDGTKPSSVTGSYLTVANPFTSLPVASNYVMLPFGNPTGNDYEAEVLTHGKPILNGLVNMQIVAPDAYSYNGGPGYTAHVVYIYNSTLVFSKSSAEFRF